jgi:endoglucanase
MTSPSPTAIRQSPRCGKATENQRKTVALWSKLAARYKDEPWIGGYD